MHTTTDVTARLQSAQQAVNEAGLTALLISPGPDLRYLTGYQAIPLERLTCLVVPAAGSPRIVVPFLERQSAVDSPISSAGIEVLAWREEEDPYGLVASLLPSTEGAVALSDRMWAAQAIALRNALPGLEQQPAGPVLGTLRARKSDDEVAALREAGLAVDAVHGQMREWIRVGRTEREVADDISSALLRAGHERVDFVIVASGPNSANPHHGATDRVIRAGDVVVVDIGGTMPSGYCSDSTRTYVLGEPPERVRAFYAVLQAAQESACVAVRKERQARQWMRRLETSSLPPASASSSSIARDTASGSRPTKSPTSVPATGGRWPRGWSSASSLASTSPGSTARALRTSSFARSTVPSASITVPASWPCSAPETPT